MALSSTERFSSRVDNYVKYRPGYPSGVLDLLQDRCGLRSGTVVADIGSGTGILTALLLERGAQVFAIEPNRAMRAAAERLLGGRAGFHSIPGTAEQTTLPAASVALVVASQAFHWFDPGRARRELTRILVPAGWAALIWNERPEQATPFLADYEMLLKRYAAEYEQVTSRRVEEGSIREFFGRAPELATFANGQVFDFEGLKGRLMSSSYAPESGDPLHAPLISGLRQAFDRHQRDGRIVFPYRTLVYFGPLSS